MKHLCHAYGCNAHVPPKMLMCLKHWRMVDPRIQRLVWSTYFNGQEIRKDPTKAYILVQRSAVWCVFVAEGGCKWPDVPEVGTEAYLIGPAALAAPVPAPNITIPAAPAQRLPGDGDPLA